ncbi:M28 family peptidase [Novosphingobium sp.]|uniref:M28 family peptidase n=1 Tax=Novosphingobium sp. TaxID=1874826 RepID=UPI0033427051
MRIIATFALTAAAMLSGTAALAQTPGPVDADTRAWWALTSELSGDDMDGRDTGSPGYDRAAALVARRFAQAGLKPAGTAGGWFQDIALDDLRLDEAQSHFAFGTTTLAFNRDILLSPGADTPPHLSAAATFRGYCAADDIADVAGKLVVCYGRPAPKRLASFDRAKALRSAGALGMLTIAAPGLASEPIRWPFAYSRSVTIAGTATPATTPFLSGIINPDALPRLLPDAAQVLATGAAGGDLPHADLGPVVADLTITHTVTHSANVLGLLPGTDPALAAEIIVVGAHLDGYGHGEPVNGDGLYNGALDDAAYVALLERLAAARAGHGFARPVLFAVFTGEEKGLLGSTWFVEHPTLPLASVEAMINLDQIRPLYPLKLMTVHGLSDSNLADPVRQIATASGFAVQEDPEPERNLLRRSDNWPFMRAGIPGLSFVLATYDQPSLMRYYDWYERRYHHPADDLTTPIDWQAAADFNAFFYSITEAAANSVANHPWKNTEMRKLD